MPLGSIDPGKVVGGYDPRARKPAASHESRTRASGGVSRSAERAGSSCRIRGEGEIGSANVLTVWAFAAEHDHVLRHNASIARSVAPLRALNRNDPPKATLVVRFG